MRRISTGDIVITPDDRPGARRAEVPAEPRKADTRKAGMPKKARKRLLPRPRLFLTPLQKLAAGGVAVTALVVGMAVVWHSGAPQRLARHTGATILAASAEAGFRVEEITIAGRTRTPTAQIAAALGSHHGAPILGLDLAAAKDRLEALPSVRAAAVERRLPGHIHLAIVEREPVALWQNQGQFTLVDRDGHQIPGGIEGFEDLPLVVGEGAAQRADELLTMLASEPKLAQRVKAAVRVGNRRWNIRLDDAEKGIEVRLPDEEPQAAWHRLAELDREHGLTNRNITMVDMRVPDRLVLKTEREAVQSAKAKDNGA